MATWVSHFRIAEYFLNRIDGIDEKEFIVGNIGPDCGEPNEDWSVFTPSSNITHWSTKKSKSDIDADKFFRTYLTGSHGHHSFYLGYYLHLLSDIEWNRQIYRPKKDIYKSEFEQDGRFIWIMKKDWYDLDHLFLKDNPDFYTFKVFSSIEYFPNRYLDYYSESAFIRQIKYITNFYKGFDGNLDREYIYLTKQEMDAYIRRTCGIIADKLYEKGLYERDIVDV